MEGLLGLIVIGFVIWILVENKESKGRLREAKAAYERSLARLKEDPGNPDLKQKTLGLGRVYSNLTRENKGVTIYDEVALSNDISAACAAVYVPPSNAVTFSPEDRLAKLANMRSQGLVDEEEYQAQRRRILSEL